MRSKHRLKCFKKTRSLPVPSPTRVLLRSFFFFYKWPLLEAHSEAWLSKPPGSSPAMQLGATAPLDKAGGKHSLLLPGGRGGQKLPE